MQPDGWNNTHLMETMNIDKSIKLFQEAQELLPGGVDSPVRSFRAVGGQPLFIERGAGPYLFDVDGHRYIDYVLSWGPLITGHAHPKVVEAIQQAAPTGPPFFVRGRGKVGELSWFSPIGSRSRRSVVGVDYRGPFCIHPRGAQGFSRSNAATTAV